MLVQLRQKRRKFERNSLLTRHPSLAHNNDTGTRETRHDVTCDWSNTDRMVFRAHHIAFRPLKTIRFRVDELDQVCDTADDLELREGGGWGTIRRSPNREDGTQLSDPRSGQLETSF
ncbi:hypothetical protein J6590_097895 [Homalodisca vitripennis]|nr:hypothetical protein J6590_097895 [Homalodisca vitripennis]